MFLLSRRRVWPLWAVLAATVTATGPARAQVIDQIEATPNSGPTDVVTAPDGTIWFVETAGNQIGSINPLRTDLVEVSLKIPNSQPTSIAVDSRGQVWFTESGNNRIGVYTPWTGALVEYYWGGSSLGLAGIAADSQGRLFFTENQTNRIGMLDPGRLTLQYYTWTTENVGPLGIECDSSGRAWFTENRAGRVGVLDPYWNYVYDYYYAAPGSAPYGITVDIDNDVWFTNQASGEISLLDQASGLIFQFDGINGANSQPRYIDTFQNDQNQTIVAWAEPTPGNGVVGLLNADTGVQSQIQASNPFAAPTGVSFAPDKSLWFTEQNTSQIGGWYYNGTLVRRPAPRSLRLASMQLLTAPRMDARPALSTLAVRADTQVLLVKKENKQATARGKGRQKQAEIKKETAKIQQLALTTADQYQPPKKAKKTNKGRGGNGNGNGGGQGRGNGA
jgi:streptogramin lyase